MGKKTIGLGFVTTCYALHLKYGCHTSDQYINACGSKVGSPARPTRVAGWPTPRRSPPDHSPDIPLVRAVFDVVAERLEHPRGRGDGAAVEHLKHPTGTPS